MSSSSSTSENTVRRPPTNPSVRSNEQTTAGNSRLRAVVRAVMWAGTKIQKAVETVGEAVVSVIGIDDSMFQDVMDGMTEEQMEAARAVHEEREREYREAGILVDPIMPLVDEPDNTGILLTKQLASYMGINISDLDENDHNGTGNDTEDEVDLEQGGVGNENQEIGRQGNYSAIPTNTNDVVNVSAEINSQSNANTDPITSPESMNTSGVKSSDNNTDATATGDGGVKLDEIVLVA